MKVPSFLIIAILLIALVVIVTSQQPTSSGSCSNLLTCGQCISSKDCQWCSKDGYKSFRCAKIGEHRDCSNEIKVPGSPEINFIQNDELAQTTGSDERDLTLVKPQQVKIDKLTPNQPANFHIKFKQAVDYPVDLYYLMDLSYTMKDDKEVLVKVSQQLADEMKGITSNFRLGFGSFVDKVILPYTSTTPEKYEMST